MIKVKPFEFISYENEKFIDMNTFICPDVEKGRFLISNYGRVFDTHINRIRKTGQENCYQYLSTTSVVTNKQVNLPIHRFVKKYFGDEPFWFEDLDINHKDGIKTNNYIDNLEWCTRQENIQHAFDNNLNHKGVLSIHSKIKDEQTVVKICELLESGKYTNAEIVEILGGEVTISIVESIKKKESWVEISKKYNFYQRPGKIFTTAFVENLCQYFQDNPKPENLSVNDHCRNAFRSLGEDFNDSIIDCARKIYIKKYYTRISSKYSF